MHWLGKVILVVAGLPMLGMGVWLMDTAAVIVQIGGALSSVMGVVLIVLAFSGKTNKQWQRPEKTTEE